MMVGNEKGYPRPKGPPPTTTTTTAAPPCGSGYLVAPLPPSGPGPSKGYQPPACPPPATTTTTTTTTPAPCVTTPAPCPQTTTAPPCPRRSASKGYQPPCPQPTPPPCNRRPAQQSSKVLTTHINIVDITVTHVQGYQAPACPPPVTTTQSPCSGYIIAALTTPRPGGDTPAKGYQPPSCPPPATTTTPSPCRAGIYHNIIIQL